MANRQAVRSDSPDRPASRTAAVICMTVVLLFSVGGAFAFAEADPESGQALSPLVGEHEDGSRVEAETDPTASEVLPHVNLGREEAEELLQGVFGDELEASAEFFDELEVEAFRSDNVALVDPPEPGAAPGLLSSTLPLRAEDESGQKEILDLGLQPDGNHLEPANALADVAVPTDLSDGISMPDAGVEINLASVDVERSASEIGEASVFYPNVRAQTDVAITALPTGVETYTHLRSPEAPRSEVFELDIPSGSTLVSSKEGGAEVLDADGETVLSVAAPWAMDAEGDQVPSDLTIDGHSIIVSVDPSADATYPILLDPVFESYNFNGQSTPGTAGKDWSGASNPGFYHGWSSSPNYGMTVQAFGGATSPGNQAMFNYYVPRYWSDIQAGLPKPLSYIRSMSLWNLTYMTPDELSIPTGNRSSNPFMQLSLWDENHEQFVYLKTRYGNEGQWTDGSYVFSMTNPNENTDVKRGGFAIATFSSSNPFWRYVNVQQASVEVTDQDLPGWASMPNPSGWMDQTAKVPLEYSVSDAGLGIYSFRVTQPKWGGGSQLLTTSNSCVGTAGNPCPRTATDKARAITYEPKTMAQGENVVSVTALDPVGNQSAPKLIKVKVDHSGPALSLSGNLTEQGTAGTNLSEYTLNYAASDGDDAAAAAQTPVGTSGTGQGQLERPVGMAIDADGDVWTADRTRKKIIQYDKNGKFLSEFGTAGTADGQLGDMRGLAIAPNGNVWIAEAGERAAQQFTPDGGLCLQNQKQRTQRRLRDCSRTRRSRLARRSGSQEGLPVQSRRHESPDDRRALRDRRGPDRDRRRQVRQRLGHGPGLEPGGGAEPDRRCDDEIRQRGHRGRPDAVPAGDHRLPLGQRLRRRRHHQPRPGVQVRRHLPAEVRHRRQRQQPVLRTPRSRRRP